MPFRFIYVPFQSHAYTIWNFLVVQPLILHSIAFGFFVPLLIFYIPIISYAFAYTDKLVTPYVFVQLISIFGRYEFIFVAA